MPVPLRVATAFLALAALAAAPADPPDPAKIKDKVTVTLGKSLVVKFERKGTALVNPKPVDAAGNDPPTPTFDFREQDDNRLLVTKNPFPADLKFRALARHAGKKTYFETSIVPVKAGLFSIELWQEPIEELVLFDFSLPGAK